MNRWLLLLLFPLCLISYQETIAIFPINVFRPWDLNLRPTPWPGKHIQLVGYDEIGLKVQAFDADKSRENVMQLWTDTQDAIAMLQGFPASSPFYQYYTNVLMMPVDDGIRGNFLVKGHFEMTASAGLSCYYRFPHYVTLSAHIPFYAMSVSHVNFMDLTQNNNNASNLRVKQNLTNNFAARLLQFDPTLTINGWSRVGFGDLGIMAEWRQGFKQSKPYLKNVELALRTCLTLPTGLQRNENQILSVPFGYEALGLMFGAGIKLTWLDWVRAGVDFEFLQLFGNNRTFRIKVQEDQTDFLLLAQAKAHKEFGFTQRYNLCLETCPLVRGLSIGMAYEFWKHGKDKYDLLDESFSAKIANSAQSLQEWTMHQLIFKLWYDCAGDVREDSAFRPQFLFFYKVPVNGKRALLINSIGAQITMNF